MESDIVPRHLFNKTVEAIGIQVPQEKIKEIISSNAELLFNTLKINNITSSQLEGYKIILFNKNSIIPDTLLKYEKSIQTVQLTYANFTYVDILKELLPKDIVIPTGFETIGHIAHFNLNPLQMPYKNIIGQVLLDVYII